MQSLLKEEKDFVFFVIVPSDIVTSTWMQTVIATDTYQGKQHYTTGFDIVHKEHSNFVKTWVVTKNTYNNLGSGFLSGCTSFQITV